jgi:DNA polymerase-1
VREFKTTLGGDRVTIVAPRPGTFDRERFVETFPGGALYGLDVESTYLTGAGLWDPAWRLRTVQLATETEGWVLRPDDPAQASAVAALLADESAEFCSHTQIDTLAVLRGLGVDIADRNLDTHVLSIMSAPDDTLGQADLKTVTTRFGMPELKRADVALGRVFDRMYREAHPEVGRKAVKVSTLEQFGFDNVDLDDPVFLGYAGLDAIAVRRVVPKLVEATRAPVHLLRNERWLSTQVTRMRATGWRIDRPAAEALHAETEAVVAEVTAEMAEVTDGLKPTQGKALVEFFGREGADWSNHPQTKGKAPSLGDGAVGRLESPALHPDLSAKARRAAALYGRHASVLDRLRKTEAILAGLDCNDRIHATILSIGTVTGRMSGSGPNMQNFAKVDRAMRGLVLPDTDDDVLISTDFSQIELRVLAALAREAVMIEVITGNGDLHQLTADLLGITRQEAKTVNFLIVYGGGGAKLAAQLNWARTEDECKGIIREYWGQYPAIADLRERLQDETDAITLLSGRRVPVGYTKDGDRRYWANLNYSIQGNARELLVGAWRRFVETNKIPGVRVWLPVHDELVTQAPRARAAEVAEAVRAAMTFDFLGVPIVAESDVLLDEADVSRWMSGDTARKIAELKLAA